MLNIISAITQTVTPAVVDVTYLVVAGGGSSEGATGSGGAGGAGGYLTSTLT